MKLTVFIDLLIIFSIITLGSTSCNEIWENELDANGTIIHQFMFLLESVSMSPSFNIGDISIIEDLSRTSLITWEGAEKSNYKSFTLPGDVVLYRPYGRKINDSTPILHRIIRWVDTGEPMWEDGPAAPFSGYITKGDHNKVIDQQAGQIFGVARDTYLTEHQNQIEEIEGDSVFLDKDSGLIIYRTDNHSYVGDGISYLVPVKEEWVIGVARSKISYGVDWTRLQVYT